MNGVDTLIARWPSMAELGRDLGLPYSTVAAWKQRGFLDVNSDFLIALHDNAQGRGAAGFAEDPPRIDEGRRETENDGHGSGQFSRWKALRRAHFATGEEVTDHVRGLRDEWNRR